MQKLISLLLFFIFLANALQAQSAKANRNVEYKNGVWFNGTAFSRGNWYSQNGILTQKAPAKIDTTVDLGDRWVVPPMADAACASLSASGFQENMIGMYMDEGVFYLQVIDNVQDARKSGLALLNKANAPDATFSNGNLTCTLGYPFTKFEGPANNLRTTEAIDRQYETLKAQRKMLGNGYWFFDKKEDVNNQWNSMMAQKPAILTIVLHDAVANGGKEGKGLKPEVAKALIKKAHKSKIRVFAKVQYASDAALALQLGADGLLNLPGNDWDGSGDAKRFEISDTDLKKMAKKKMVIIPSYGLCMSNGPKGAVQDLHRNTLKKLLEYEAMLAMGSHDEQRTIRLELSYWVSLEAFKSQDQMMRVLCDNAARAIFPERKIGKLAEGYEATFLVLNDNPLTNILKMRVMSFAVKHGEIVKGLRLD